MGSQYPTGAFPSLPTTEVALVTVLMFNRTSFSLAAQPFTSPVEALALLTVFMNMRSTQIQHGGKEQTGLRQQRPLSARATWMSQEADVIAEGTKSPCAVLPQLRHGHKESSNTLHKPTPAAEQIAYNTSLTPTK